MKSLALILVFVPLAAAAAATITANTPADNTTAGDGQCTLREAIANVNAAADTTAGDCAAGTGAGDTISFSLTLPATVRLTPTLGELAIGRDVTIIGPAARFLRIDGVHKTRVFEVQAGTTSMSNLTIQRGNAGTGAGIMVNTGATLNLAHCVVATNRAAAGQYAESRGGAIYNAGTLHLTDCALTRNTVVASNGGAGAGMYNDAGTATLNNCMLAGNKFYAVFGEVFGGGIYNDGGAVTLTNCTLTRNRANGGYFDGGNGGGIYNDESGTVELTNSMVSRNRAGSPGFGAGGGIYNAGSVTLTNSVLTRNVASSSTASIGGAIYNGGSMALTSSTLSRNVARARNDGECAGGGIENEGGMILTNCTLASNRASSGYAQSSFGGAIDTVGGTLLTNCTLSGNTASFGNGGGISGEARLTNTIINTSGAAGNCDGTITSGGHNLSSDGTCFTSGGTDLLNADPMLARLANYGGPTDTMALHAASPAIDAGDDAITGPPDNLTTDQRGLPRQAGGHVDIGAYEVQ